MANARWWLLLLASVLFSLSGCASHDEWTTAASHPAPGLSGPGAPTADLSGRWRGEWRAPGLFGSARTSVVEATFEQRGTVGVGRLTVSDTTARDVPWVVRQEGPRGVRLAYDVDGGTMTARHVDGARLLTMWLSLVDDQLVGSIDSDSPVVIVLSRDDSTSTREDSATTQ